ncbi:Maf family protein [Conservatibacter flavescens]|uniref:dTTP/UTP pyrophosphatase n=1 Tax=Conservatibacter flavescens TaxID=28161 RepID=A0A2M8S1N6_9PAST|nr:Maf family protein [Conservatibacter flavescens]PJG85053.1 septum formation inhibitor Maf [Conservatibacter flavescens]
MNRTLYLASQSPRRWELLKNLGLTLLPLASEVDESVLPNERASDYCLRIARLKSQAAQAVKQEQQLTDYPILTADTTVSIDEQILGKPKDAQQAFAMLKQLSGRTHQVFTAVCVSFAGQHLDVVQTSEVTFKCLSHEEILAYIATKEPMDKAGAYGIQQLGGVFIEHLSGSFSGVMGLPIFETSALLKQVGISVL